MLSQAQISEFKETGLLVVENVLTDEEITTARSKLHTFIAEKTGVEHGSENWGTLGHRLKGPANTIYYAKWKLLDIHLHPRTIQCYDELLAATYGPSNVPDFEHPYGPCEFAFAYPDRVCYRLPDAVSAEGGLSLHLGTDIPLYFLHSINILLVTDRNPLDPYLAQAGGLKRWRPIQSFVCLTDHYSGDSGGLRVVRGFHKDILNYFTGNKEAIDAIGTSGEFFRMTSKSFSKLQKHLQLVVAPRGSLVLWDSRLPHATCDTLTGFDSREVVYNGFLPAVPLNCAYVEEQGRAIRDNVYPQHSCLSGHIADRDWDVDDLTPTQRRVLGV